MRDMHCHILPGVDDGSGDLGESLAMLEAAKRAGVTSIVCTPHCRDPYFDYDAMLKAFEVFRSHAGGFPVSMGFEVNHRKLMDLGMEWAPRLGFRATNEFLLELSTHATKYDFKEYENTIYQLQAMGYQVIIAHPERYRLIQEDISYAENLVRMGCKLQASTDFVAGGRFGREKKPAKRLLDAGLYTYFASDAHLVKHYDYLRKAYDKYGGKLPAEAFEDAPRNACANPFLGADLGQGANSRERYDGRPVQRSQGDYIARHASDPDAPAAPVVTHEPAHARALQEYNARANEYNERLKRARHAR